MDSTALEILNQKFGPDSELPRLALNQSLARLTTARVGGPADALLIAESAGELAEIIAVLWSGSIPYIVIGGGSNILVSDAGYRGVAVVNRARQMYFQTGDEQPTVWAESGVNFGAMARQACGRGLSGLEWAVGIPGTVGGAIVGNAGAHGADVSNNLIMAEILHRELLACASGKAVLMKEEWPVERFAYRYRSSVLKRQHGQVVVLSALLRLSPCAAEIALAKADGYTEHRRRTQPHGATMGSMFKNPPGGYAGRLIEEAGLKGHVIGDAEISTQHANFFINRGNASAKDFYDLIQLVRKTVADKFGVQLEPEIELIGEWA